MVNSGGKLLTAVEGRVDRSVVTAEDDGAAGDRLRLAPPRRVGAQLVARAEGRELEGEDLELLARQVIPVEALVLGEALLDVGEVLPRQRLRRKLSRSSQFWPT